MSNLTIQLKNLFTFFVVRILLKLALASLLILGINQISVINEASRHSMKSD